MFHMKTWVDRFFFGFGFRVSVGGSGFGAKVFGDEEKSCFLNCCFQLLLLSSQLL